MVVNIDLSVKEYFEQLQLMETQYGMEEELYPWIYMLLCSVDNNKQKLLGESYGGISIRDVHNAKSGGEALQGITKDIKKFMQKSAFPEFALFNRNIDSNNGCQCFGCVEIKVLGMHYIELGNKVEYIIKKNPKKYEYEMKFMKKDDSGKAEYYCFGINKSQYEKLKSKNYDFLVDFDRENNKIEVTYYENNHKQHLKITGFYQKKYNGRRSVNTYVREIPIWNTVKPFDNDIVAEMVSHITNYKKVLYTNGLQFCYIECLDDSLDNNQINFTVTEIANLNNYYIAYKKKRIVENNAILEWEKLKLGLMSIEWQKNPIEITSLNL